MSTDDWRNALDSLEHRLQREIRKQIMPVLETLKDVKREVQTTNGRVTNLEADRIRRDAADGVRAEIAKDAVDAAATRAAEAVAKTERSRRWWLAVVSAATGGIIALTTFTSLLGTYLSHH